MPAAARLRGEAARLRPQVVGHEERTFLRRDPNDVEILEIGAHARILILTRKNCDFDTKPHHQYYHQAQMEGDKL